MMGHRALLAVLVVGACAGPPPFLIADAPPAVCGNGTVEGDEACDGDDCNADCTGSVEREACGNGAVDDGEACDDGNRIGGDGCSADCTSTERCGNGTLDTTVGETCDDGNTVGGDGCSANCQSNEACGNFNVDVGEQCDAGPNGSATCDLNCTVALCGDGTVNAFRGEQCDAGPDGDASCDTDCTPAFCGDVTVNTTRGEACDDGNAITTDACIGCQAAACGDGFLRTGIEQCDDGNAVMTDACTDCRNAFCGDGFVRTGVEQCDDGNAAVNDACIACKPAVCGDGFVRTGIEQCDDANASVNDACIACKAAVCGDGFVRTGVEQCDDGNTVAGDGCNANCQIEQQPKVYILNNLSCNPQTQQCSSNQLLGFVRECGGADGDVTNPYDNCSNQPTGFTWVDSTPFQPSKVTIEVNNGIHTDFNGNPTTLTAVTNLNGTASGNFALNPNPGGNVCNPTEVLNTWTLTNVASYRRNQQNTLAIAGMGFTPQGVSKCFGVSFTNAFNGFVRITVFP